MRKKPTKDKVKSLEKTYIESLEWLKKRCLQKL